MKGVVNDLVRRKIREIREKKGMTIREMSESTALAYSSYASMELGQYNINLDNLFRILGVLDVDIHDVWPVPVQAADGADALYLRRVQQFRLGEVIALSAAEGAALFALKNDKCEALMHQGLSDFLLDRLINYLSDGTPYREGVLFRKQNRDTTFYFFMKCEECPGFVEKMVRKYLAIWAAVFSA